MRKEGRKKGGGRFGFGLGIGAGCGVFVEAYWRGGGARMG